jgi:hypothetical protein
VISRDQWRRFLRASFGPDKTKFQRLFFKPAHVDTTVSRDNKAQIANVNSSVNQTFQNTGSGNIIIHTTQSNFSMGDNRPMAQ